MVICKNIMTQLAEDSDNGYYFLAMKCLLIKVVPCFFRHNAIAHLIDYTIEA